MSGDSAPLHEFEHPTGLRIRVPKGFSTGRMPADCDLQLVLVDKDLQFPIALLDDISAYLKALAWYEGDAMTPASPDWPAFTVALKSKEGIDFRPEWEDKKRRAQGPYRFSCSCSDRPDDWKWDGESLRWPKAVAILKKQFPAYDVQDSMAYWMLHKADCDCLLLFRVNAALTTGFARMIGAETIE